MVICKMVLRDQEESVSDRSEWWESHGWRFCRIWGRVDSRAGLLDDWQNLAVVKQLGSEGRSHLDKKVKTRSCLWVLKMYTRQSELLCVCRFREHLWQGVEWRSAVMHDEAGNSREACRKDVECAWGHCDKGEVCGTGSFKEKLRQGSALSPFLCETVIDRLTDVGRQEFL